MITYLRVNPCKINWNGLGLSPQLNYKTLNLETQLSVSRLLKIINNAKVLLLIRLEIHKKLTN